MSRDNAIAIVKNLRDEKLGDEQSINRRIEDLEAEEKNDPWEGTRAQITRLRLRVVHLRLEAEALTILLEDK